MGWTSILLLLILTYAMDLYLSVIDTDICNGPLSYIFSTGFDLCHKPAQNLSTQKCAIRSIAKTDYKAQGKSLFKKLNIPDIFSIYSFKVGTFINHYYNKLLPLPIQLFKMVINCTNIQHLRNSYRPFWGRMRWLSS